MKRHIKCGGRVYEREHLGSGWWKYDLCCEKCGREDLVLEEVEEVEG